MPKALDPFRFVLIAVAGWMNQRRLQMIDYLREENRVFREQLGERRLRLTDEQRRRLAAKAKGLGRKLLAEVATIVTPETLLRWHQRLIAQKYDGSRNRGLGRPRTATEPQRAGPLWAAKETGPPCPAFACALLQTGALPRLKLPSPAILPARDRVPAALVLPSLHAPAETILSPPVLPGTA